MPCEDPRTGVVTDTPTTPSYQIPLHQANLDVVKGAMVDVVRVGTARQAFRGAAYQAAGKTGTAQVYSLRGARYRASAVDERLRDHALFMGFAPADHPRIAVALIVENAGWGPAPPRRIARKVFDAWLTAGPSGRAAQAAQRRGRRTRRAAGRDTFR